MFILNLRLIVFVAAVAGVGLQAIRVADLALAHSTFAMINWEDMRFIIPGWRPGQIGMAGGAIWAEQALMVLRFRMTGLTLLGRALEDRPCFPL